MIYTGYAEDVYAGMRNLEETLIHEHAHTSLDPYLIRTDTWNNAVAEDNFKYVSNYAKDWPNREDVAETFVLWFATRYTPEEFAATAERLP